MAAPTFTPPRPPVSPATEDTAPRVFSNEFDGYTQRVGAGTNAIRPRWSLVFRCHTTAEADAIVNFFIARRGVEPFRWTPPQQAVPLVWICSAWRRRLLTGGRVDIEAIFERDFTLGA